MRTRSVLIVLLALVAVLTLAQRQGSHGGDCKRAENARSPSGLQLFYLKREHTLCLLRNGSLAWSAPASHGRNPGKKRFEGDGRTPEGAYSLSPARKSEKFGTFLAISYPSAEDVRFARTEGRQPGSAVGIHGPQGWYAFLGRWQAAVDHSDGCIVLDREAVEELAAQVPRPLPLTILP